MTDIQITPKYAEVKPQGFYVYLHKRKSDGKTFYVGKGSGNRAWSKAGRNKYWLRIARKHGVEVAIVLSGISETCAFSMEIALIEFIGIDNLCNKSTGGDGPSGSVSKRRKKVFSSLREEFESIHKAADHMRSVGYKSAAPINISNCAHGKRAFAYGRDWSFVNFPEHSDLFNGYSSSCIKVYSSCGKSFTSLLHASKWLISIGYKSATGSGIKKSIDRESIAYDRIWSTDSAPTHDGRTSSHHKRVSLSKPIVSSLGEVFDGAGFAVDWLKENGYKKASHSSISRSCKTGGMAYGRTWRQI